MARRSRFHLPSAIYHVMLRGNDGQPIFFSDADRCRLCLLMQEGVERFGHSIYSFCFMTNHIHLAIQVRDTNISRIIQNLAFRYTRYFNKKHKRIGHLFQGRFKSIIVDGNQYLRELIRYIHLNPVRASLVNLPENYPWSSHRAYLQLDNYAWLICDHVLKTFGGTWNDAMTNYEDFILKGIGIETELDFKSGHSKGILGNKEFVEDFFETVVSSHKKEIALKDLVAKVCKRLDISETALCSSGKNRLQSHTRAILALLVRESENISIEELAAFLRRDPSGLSKLANRLERKCTQSATLAATIDDLRKLIYTPVIQMIPFQMSECQA